MRIKPTKKDKAKVILTALYNLPALPDESQAIWERRINKLARLKVTELERDYLLAKDILSNR